MTVKQERFAYEYVKQDGCGPNAIIAAFGEKTRNAARVAAYKMLRKPHVWRKVEEVRAKMAKRSDITIEKILTDYEQALQFARQQEKAGDMVSAATAQAKLVGLLRDRVEQGNPGDFDHLDDISAIVEKVAAEAGPEAAQALMRALGYETPAAEPTKDDTELLEAAPASNAVN